MDNSLKIGIISGLIAGIVAGIIYTLSINYATSIGFFATYWREIMPNTYGVNISLGIIFGIVLGIIYAKIYDVIPGNGLSKSIFYSLIIFFLSNFRNSTYLFAYAMYLNAAGIIFIGFFKWIVYGLMLGFLYEFLIRYYPREKLEIITYDVKSGIFPGTIAGLAGGIAAAAYSILGPAIGIFEIPGYPAEPSLDVLIGQVGSHVVINMFWGAIMGAIFARVYNLVPGKRVLKGLIYGLIISFFVYGFQIGIHHAGYGLYSSSQIGISLAVWTIFVNLFLAIAFGVVLGYLYRIPAEAPIEEKEDIQTFKMVKCIHCNASIPQDSKYCKECSKKQ